MKSKLAKYQNEYINFLVEVIFWFFLVKDKTKDKKNTHFSALTTTPLLISERRRTKSKELTF
jgi:hypothetical protein